MFVHPQFSPYIFQIGGIGPTWYGLMYVIAFVLGYQLAVYRAKYKANWTKDQVGDLLFYLVIGTVVGGRLGYMLFYNFDAFISNPLTFFQVQKGGMAFHGGLIGVTVAFAYFSFKHKHKFLEVADFIAPIIPIGLFFGRIGNFINAELWGKPTDVSWAVIFPNVDMQPRHASQLYEAVLEGLVLFIVLYLYSRKPRFNGQIGGMFLLGYAIARFIVEFYRLPDAHIGYLAFDWLTMGQLLCVPMFLIGLAFVVVPKWLHLKKQNNTQPAS